MTSRSSATILTKRSISSACSRTSSESFCSCPSRRSRRQANSPTVSPALFAGRDAGLEALRGSAATTTSLFMLTPFFSARLACTLAVSIIRRGREVNDSASFLFPRRPAKIRLHDEYLHHGAGGRKRRAAVSAHRSTRQTRRPLRRQISHHRLYAQQLLELRLAQSGRPNPIQISLA